MEVVNELELICIPIQHYLLICTLLNDQTVLFSQSQQS